MKKFEIKPTWVRKLILVIYGLSCLFAAGSMTLHLVSDEAPSLGLFLPLIVGFLLGGSIFVFALNQKGPLKEFLWVSGTLTAVSAIAGAVAMLLSPSSEPFVRWVQPLVMAAFAIFVFWSANVAIKSVNHSEAS
tara:strand:+ start:587 stop:988 length:402 start_codon:yes stop_codon:yes gene_type:complete